MLHNIYYSNYILAIGVTGWLCAQVLKTIINWILVGKFDPERIFGAGGMPSSHTALVCSMVIATAKVEGTGSPIFAIAFLVAGIVMYDAMGVRRETGIQAQILNKMIYELIDKTNKLTEILPNDKKLKELVGHTPFEVLGGAILGILIGVIIPY